MKRKRFSVEQIVAVLKQAELGLPVVDLIRQRGPDARHRPLPLLSIRPARALRQH